MVKTIDKITIVGTKESFTLNNKKNQATVMFNEERNTLSFQDSYRNSMFNYPAIVRINSETFKLTNRGQTIRRSDGTISAYLSTNDVQELAQYAFYEEGQTHIFDFLNLTFNVPL